MENFKCRFGRMVRKKRREIDLTQEKLAEIIGVTTGAIGQFERGETLPSSENLIALIRHLGLNPEEVFLDETIKDPQYIELCSLFSQMNNIQRDFVLGMAKYVISNHVGEMESSQP